MCGSPIMRINRVGRGLLSVSTGKLPLAFETLSSSLVGPSKRVVGFKVRAGFVVAGTSSASTQRQNNSGAILVSAMGRF